MQTPITPEHWRGFLREMQTCKRNLRPGDTEKLKQMQAILTADIIKFLRRYRINFTQGIG